MFQHRHYVKLASIIAGLPEGQREAVAIHFADGLKGTNPAYSPTRFYSAAIGEPANGRDRA